MFFVTSNKPKKLLYMSFIHHVTVAELQRGLADMEALLAELPSGYKLLVDLERLQSMDLACADEIGKIMELNDRKKVGLVVRVIPDPAKDIGMNILTLFHYRHKPRVTTCKTMTEAAELLSL